MANLTLRHSPLPPSRLITTVVLMLGLTTGVTLANAQDAADRAADHDRRQCDARPDWISDPSIPERVDGRDSCAFYQHGWQAFLGLVLADSGNPPFVDYNAAAGAFPADDNPLPWGEQPSLPDDCTDAMGNGGAADVHFTLGQIANADHHIVDADEILQAGSSQPVVDNDARWLHYLVQLNQPAYDYITQCDLYKQACFDSVGPNISFPASAMELKTAWKILETCELPDSAADCRPDNPDDYYTLRAAVSPYGPDERSCRIVNLGLVGMHIVQKTPRHPEWLWITFEHRRNAPDCDRLHGHEDDGHWNLFDPECSGAYCEPNAYCDPCTQACGQSNTYDAQCEKPAIPTQVCRATPFPEDVAQLNHQTQRLLHEQRKNPWFHYELVGVQYKKNGDPTGQDSGSLFLANTTMETYLQRIVHSPVDPPNNTGCLSCHDATYYPSTEAFQQADFSHVFRESRNPAACGTALPAYCPKPVQSP